MTFHGLCEICKGIFSVPVFVTHWLWKPVPLRNVKCYGGQADSWVMGTRTIWADWRATVRACTLHLCYIKQLLLIQVDVATRWTSQANFVLNLECHMTCKVAIFVEQLTCAILFDRYYFYTCVLMHLRGYLHCKMKWQKCKPIVFMYKIWLGANWMQYFLSFQDPCRCSCALLCHSHIFKSGIKYCELFLKKLFLLLN